MSELKRCADYELNKLGYGYMSEDPDVVNTYNSFMQIVDTFAKMGHSGSSARWAIDVINKLLSFEPLTPLTGESDEWNEVGPGVYQNKRCSRVFSETGAPEGHAYDIKGKVFTREGEEYSFTNKDSHTSVTFPYVPYTEYVTL